MLEVAELQEPVQHRVLIVVGEGGINLPGRPLLSSRTGRHNETVNPLVIIA